MNENIVKNIRKFTMEFSQDDTVFLDTKIVATQITDKKKLLSQQICILKEWTLTSISVQIHVILR